MSAQRGRGPGPIPKRWLHCPQRSDELIADKFIALKTPLSDKYDDQVGDEFSFYPSMIFDLIKMFYKKRKIGLWIDLTNTRRFYDRSAIETKQCQYVKLQCRGHGETPSREQTQSFIEIVEDYAANNPLDIIAVHCTHGFNRTGFLICSYLIEKHDYAVDAAINVFASFRPPGIYKQDYIDELLVRYRNLDDEEDDEPLKIAAPPKPDWCYEDEEEDDDIDAPSTSTGIGSKRSYDNTDSASKSFANGDDSESHNDKKEDSAAGQPPNKRKRMREQIKHGEVFMDGVPGVNLMTDLDKVNELRAIAQIMCGWRTSGFPGSQPVSMTRENIKLLHTKPYKVSWKADGTRYMMLILQEREIYFFDRDNSCFKVDDLSFPRRDNFDIHIKNTLLDGEMVIDVLKGERIPRYLIYDVIAYEKENYAQRSFSDRMKAIKELIIMPRHEAIIKGKLNRNIEPFSVRLKDFWDITQAAALLGPKFAKQLTHEPDGLIFQPKLEPYTAGRCDDVLKWKPPEQNSVDFQLKIVQETGVGLVAKKRALLFVGSLDTPFAEMKLTKGLKELNNKIIECKFDNNEWVFMRERTDKSYPNAYTTAKSVCDTIMNPVTKHGLLGYIEKFRFRDDSDSMPPPSSSGY